MTELQDVTELRRDRFYSATQVWRISGSPRAMVYGCLQTGDLVGIRRGRRWLIPGGSAIDWIDHFARHDQPSPDGHTAEEHVSADDCVDTRSVQHPLTDEEIRARGYAPTRRGWKPTAVLHSSRLGIEP